MSERQPAIHFDAHQAVTIHGFIGDQILRNRAASFRLTPDAFGHSLDLTSYDDNGNEITHIHPRSEDGFRAS